MQVSTISKHMFVMQAMIRDIIHIPNMRSGDM